MNSTDASPSPLLELKGMRKVYQTVVANNHIDLTIMPGEIHAVLGENGAGKSTLMKMIYGVTQPTSGKLFWQGQELKISNPAQARKLGIGMVFQHFSLFETLTVVENVSLGLDHPPKLKQLAQDIIDISNRYELPIDPHRSVHALSVGEMQRVEIVRCLLQKPKLLIMDEPTSVLSPAAVRKLFVTLRQLAAEGCSILYISHKLDEIQELCHTATVLRGGKVMGNCIPSNETPESMARMMIGKDLSAYQHHAYSPGETLLEIKNLSCTTKDPFGISLKNIQLNLRAGEILGIAGISGNGQKELLYAISGEEPVHSADDIQLCGVNVGNLNPRARRHLGLCFVPEERLGRGAVPQMTLEDNALMTILKPKVVRHGMIEYDKVNAYASDCIQKFDVKCSGALAQAQSLSGGNLQKFIVGREIMQNPKVIILAQPTWGVDMGAALFIRQALLELRNKGTAILVISEEIDELFEISDRIVVMADGKLSPSKLTQETNVEEIGVWMSGMWPSQVPATPLTAH
jgi:simple sugar transport system ATP-binding protein